ncbi:hypothetical protein BDF21DRAFT_379632 [Thamnidium elegans]|uniref:Ornithine decarboxylase antizyme n=1 Tax=Thamnidium elegans TaxID=101142 RepID=A0A8H7SJF8_9FUNG|nr:hypothetical protein INT48_007029 [Thamnidium elegans]KAI8085230.1 hypothetical protein BDF21DRAFT_379632 [Thamnidium elegans]
MIIASSAKKEISIPLQPMTSVSSSNNIYSVEETAPVDLVTVNSRNKGTDDFIVQVFGQTGLFDLQVNETLSISTCKSTRTLVCEAFIHNETVFLSSPFVGANAGLLNWADGEFQSCITHLIELAEEKTGCSTLVISIDRRNYKDSLSTVLRAFMYLGFEMVNPSIYGQESGYVLVGYEL